MTARRPRPAPPRGRSTGKAREWLLLGLGSVLVLVGLLSSPRDPTSIGAGMTLLLATPAVGGRGGGEEE